LVQHPHLHSFPTRRSSDLNPLVQIKSKEPASFARLSAVRNLERKNERHPVCTLDWRESTHPCGDRLKNSCSAVSRSVSPREEIRSEEHTSELQSPCNLVCR